MEQIEEIRKIRREREQEQEERINKIERQLGRIYEKLLTLDIGVKEIRRQSRIKEIEKESEKLNVEKSYLENTSLNRYNSIQQEMNLFNENE